MTHLVSQLLDYLRTRSPALKVMWFGVMLLVAMAGINVVVTVTTKDFSFRLDTGGEATSGWMNVGWGLGVFLTIGGALWEGYRQWVEHQRLSKQLVIAIEGRGLRDVKGQPLVDAVPGRIRGRRQSILLDVRQGVIDGRIVAPEAVLPKVTGLNLQLEQLTAGQDRSNVAFVYGGMTPVPITFLTGVLLDDEDAVTVMDWDRFEERWRELDAGDDGKRFRISQLPTASLPEVVVAVSASYSVLDQNIALAFPNLPVVRLDLEENSLGAHWSGIKQKELGKQFSGVLVDLEGLGVRRVHLVLAAQNSLVFNFGRWYDKKNLPALKVYQFERDQIPPYPWAVEMPVAGRTDADIQITAIA